MSEAAIAERPAAPPDTGAVDTQAGATPELQETGTEREVQTGQEQEHAATISEDTAPAVDPEEAAFQARVEAEAERVAARNAAKAEADKAAKDAEALNVQRAERHKNLHIETVVATENVLKALPPLYDEFHQPFEWTPQLLDQITGPTKGKNLTIWEDTVAAVHKPFEDAFKTAIPEDGYEDYKKEASGKGPLDHIKIAAEKIAPTTKWAKELSLDEAEKLSKNLKADIATRVRDAILTDRKTPRKAGDVGDGNGVPSSTRSTPSSLREAQEWHADPSNPFSNADMRAYKAAHGIR